MLVGLEGTLHREAKTRQTGGSEETTYDQTFLKTGRLSDSVTGLISETDHALPSSGQIKVFIELSNIKATLEWQGGGSPTGECYLKVSSSAHSISESRVDSGPSWNVSVDTGLAGGQVRDSFECPPFAGVYPDVELGMRDPKEYERQRQKYNADFAVWRDSIPPAGARGVISRNGVKFIKVDTSSPTTTGGRMRVEKTIGITPSARGDISTLLGWGDYTTTYGELQFSPQVVNRAVIITSSLGQTFRKSTSAPTVPATEPGQPAPVPMASIPGSDPPVWKVPVAPEDTQESAANLNPLDGVWRATVSFFPNTAGFVDPTFKWTMSGGSEGINTSSAPALGGIRFEEFELGSSPDGPSPNSSTITLDVTDSLGTLSDDYSINWHKPQEWEGSAYKKDPAVWDSVEATKIIRNNAAAPGSVSGRWRWKNFYLGAMLDKDEGNVFNWDQAFANDPLSIIFLKACGIWGQQYADQDQSDHDGSFQAIWDSELNDSVSSAAATWEGGRPTKDGAWKVEYRLTNPRMVMKYQAEYWRADTYGSNGFEGLAEKSFRRRIAGTWITGDFVKDVGQGTGNE